MPDLLVSKAHHITVMTLNRPDQLNSFTTEMAASLTDAMADFDADPDQYVSIITGAGDRAFSSGRDLKELAATSATGLKVERSGVDLWGVGSSPKPTIAAINGLAVAGGFELTLNCDIRVASEDSWFGLFEVKRGIMAGIGTNLLARYLSLGDALYLLMTADRMSAQDAYQRGLIQKVVPAGEVMQCAMSVAEKIVGNSQVAVQASKKVAYFSRNHGIREQFDLYRAVNQRLLLCDDPMEGVNAFAEKREPHFSNRWPTQPSTSPP
jgi:enoyl-CoA hydratase/carnithine racemase